MAQWIKAKVQFSEHEGGKKKAEHLQSLYSCGEVGCGDMEIS